MKIKDDIAGKINVFKELCETHNVKYLYAFGSSVTDQFDENRSDIDLLIEIDESDPLLRGEHLINIWDRFESFFHRKVDLLTEASIKNPILKENINNTKILIYDGKGQKVLI